ncbi:hypothetical protein [Streptomyces sp. NPDC088348]|uniref:hypothetical protein n=1 Tax=Streptomyces sp. NPDC088348 TaxID=3365853 RepID=UPI00382E8E91
MTDAQHSSRVLSLYPRRYRASHGAEILQMYRERHILAILVAGAPWATTATGSPVGAAIVIAVLAIAWGVGRLSRGRLPVTA